MKISITIFLSLILFQSFSQTISENDLKKLALTINQKLKSKDIGNGIIMIECFAIGRTLVYQYEVPDYWEASENIKEVLIANFNSSGTGKTYFLNNINIDFYYFKNNTITKKVSIKSNEFSTYNFKLGNYFSTKGHPKAKGVNMKLKIPNDWEINEGDRPNIVKKFVNGNNTYMILIKDFVTFFSRKETNKLLLDKEFIDDFINEVTSLYKNPEILSQKVVTLDTYPTMEFIIKGEKERLGNKFIMISKIWYIFYEDKVILLSGVGPENGDFKVLEQIYTSVTNSVVFPDQYN